MIEKDRIARLTQKLIQAPSENPPGKEYKAAMIVKTELENIGLDVSIHEYEKGRPNIIATLKGKTGKTLLLNTHTDTVPAGTGWKHPPFSGAIINNKIYGRGATDCKGNTASCIEAIRNIVKTGTKLRGTLIYAATVDEETGSKNGLKALIDKGIIIPDAVLIIDSEEFHIDIAQKGLIHFTILVRGKKAHGAYPHLGDNAIITASKIITKLTKTELKHPAHPLLTPPTINIGTINGGDKINMVPDTCEIGIDLRYLPGMKKESIIASIKNIIKPIAKDCEIQIHSAIQPYEINKSERLVKCLHESIKEVRNISKHTGVEGATMVALFQNTGIPAVATGFGTKACMHATDEYARLDNLTDGAKVIEKTILKYLGKE